MSDPGKIDLSSYEAMKKQMGDGPPAATAPAPTIAPAVAEPPAQGVVAPLPAETNEPTTTMSAGQPKGGILAGIASGIGAARDAIFGLGAGIARVPGTTVGAALDLVNDIAPKTKFDPFGAGMMHGDPAYSAVGSISLLQGAGMDRKGASFENILSSKDYLGAVGNTAINQGVATLGSLVLGAEGVDEARLFRWLPKAAIQGGAVGKIAKSAFNFGVASGALTDPDAIRLSSSLNNLGIHSEFTDWLGADPSQSSHLENRFKNAVEGVIGGAAADTIFQGAKYFKSVLAGAPDKAALDAATTAAKLTIPEAGHPTESTVAAVRGAGTMDVRVDGQSVVTMPSDQYNSLLDDAKSFTTTPGAIATEHQAEVSALEAEGTLAARPKSLVESTPETISQRKPSASPLDSVPESISKAPTGILMGLDNEAVAPLVRSLAIKLHDTPHIVRTDAERNTMAAVAAREIGVDPTDMLAYVSHVAGNVADIDVATTATQILWRRMATDLDQMASRGVTVDSPLHEIQAHKSAINNVVAFSGSFQDIRSGLGRGLRSTSVFQKASDYIAAKLGEDNPMSNLFKETNPVPPQPTTVQDINDFYSIWNDLKGDPAARQNFLRGTQTLPSQWHYLRTSFANNFTANALAGLPSIGMNVVGPAIIGALHTAEKTVGGIAAPVLRPVLTPIVSAIDSLMRTSPAFTKSLDSTLDRPTAAQLLSVSTNAARAYVQTVGDVPDAFRYAWKAAKENRSILGGGWTVDVGRMGPVTDSMIRAAGMQDGPTLGYQLGNLINWWPRAFQRVNSGLDEFAKRLSYMGEIRLNAAVEHETQGADALGMDKASYVKSAMENSIDEVGEATNEDALRTSERTTLTGALSGNDYHPVIGKASQFVQSMRSQFPESRFILPVFNVPANSLGENMRRIPGLNLLLGETRDELLGNLGAVRQADAYGRTMLGGAFMLWAYHMSRQGQMTGAGPTDPGNRKAWSDQGYMPYSLRIGDKWVDYSRYDLPGAMLAIPSNMYDSTVYHRQDDPSYEARMLGSIGSLAQYFKDKAALQGASNLMNFGASPGADESFFDRTMNSVVSRSLVPNFVTQLGRNTTDDLKRSATAPSEALMNAFPMTSKELDPMRNVLGEPLHVPRDSLAENLLPVTIAPATTFKSDPVMSELDRLRQATGSAPGVTHPSAFDNNFFDSTQVKLESGRSLYDALVAARQTVKPTIDGSPFQGMNLRAALEKTFESPQYKAAKDADASNLFDSNGNASRGAVIAKIFDAYNKASIQAVAQESPIAKHMLAIVAAKKIDDDKLRAYPAPDLATNPELLKSLGIDISKYEKKVAGQ